MTEAEALRQAHQAMTEMRFEEAIALCDKILRSKPANDVVLYVKGQALGNLNRFAEALAVLEDALRHVAPDSDNAADVLIDQSDMLMELDRLDEADRCLEKALAVKPRLARIWVFKGRIAARKKNFQASLECCERAALLDPRDYRAWNNKAFAHYQLQQPDECIASAQRAVELFPQYAQAWNWMARAYEVKGDSKRARACRENCERAARGGVMEITTGHKPAQAPSRPERVKKWWRFRE